MIRHLQNKLMKANQSLFSTNSIDGTLNASTMLTDNHIRATATVEETGKAPSPTQQHKALVKNRSDRGIYFAPDFDQSSIKKKTAILLPVMINQPQLRPNKSTVHQDLSRDGSSQNRSVISQATKPDLAPQTKARPAVLKTEQRYPDLTQQQEAAQHRL